MNIKNSKFLLVLLMLVSSTFQCYGMLALFEKWLKLEREQAKTESIKINNEIRKETLVQGRQLYNVDIEERETRLRLMEAQALQAEQENEQRILQDPYLAFQHLYLEPDVIVKAMSMDLIMYETSLKSYEHMVDKECSDKHYANQLSQPQKDAGFQKHSIMSAQIKKNARDFWWNGLYERMTGGGMAVTSFICFGGAVSLKNEPGLSTLSAFYGLFGLWALYLAFRCGWTSYETMEKHRLTVDSLMATYSKLKNPLTTAAATT